MHTPAAASRPAFLGRLALGLAFALTLASTSAHAQGGGFFAGDVYEASDDVHVLGGTGASLQRIVPLSGAITPLVGGLGQSGQSCLAFDPYRQRLIWRAAVTSASATHVWLVDAAGHRTDTGLSTNTAWYAPTGDGRIYMTGGSGPFQWLDAANVVHTLLDVTGLQPYKVDGVNSYDVRGMVYSAASNSLILTSGTTCGSAAPGDAIFRRVPLSADGTQVIGPADCASYDVMGPTTTLGIGPKALALLPDGRVLLTTDSNGGLPNTVNVPRLLVLDPVAFTLAPFALTGNYPTAHVVDAGVFTQSLGKALILDTFANDLRAWAEGEAGPGTEIAPAGGIVSSGAGSAEAVELAAIPASDCSGAWLPYGAGLAGKGGRVPTLIGSGCPQAGATSTLSLANAVGGASGQIFLGLAQGTVPFKGGTLLVPTIALDVAVTLSGAPGAAGAGSLTLPALMPSGLSGTHLFLQAAFNDPAAVHKVSLSQGLEIEIG